MKRLVIVLLCLMTLSQTVVRAEEVPDINYGYVKPETVRIPLGENPEENPTQTKTTTPDFLSSIALPEKFDARDEGVIHYSGLGQQSDGTCWTFASVLCTETALGGKVNLSENHIKYASSYTGNNPYGYIKTPVDGGNFYMYTAYASNWRGPVLEADDPYAYGYDDRDYAEVTAKKPVSHHLQGTINIPNPAKQPSEISPDEKAVFLEEVKYYIYKYKCLFSSIYWSRSNFNTETRAYYNSNSATEPNHAINLIGWDDNYPKENFLNQPENNGAFIVKNSHGETGGYLYLSYEDVYAGWDSGAVTLVEDRFNYGELYTHEHFEPLSHLDANKKIDETTYLAKTTNVFTSRYDGEFVSAVGVFTCSRKLNYEIYISKTAEGNAYDESDYTFCGEGFLEMPGFHTIKLNSPFLLGDEGTKYCVRVIYKSDESFVVPAEYTYPGSRIPDTYAKEGESYYSTGNYLATDLGKVYNANLYAKAYTDAEYDIDFETENVKYSINGAEFKPGEDTTAGLNDEITLEFTNLTSTYSVNGTVYPANEKITVVLKGDLLIAENREANIKTESENESLTLDTLSCAGNTYSVSITPEFEGEKTVIVAYYSNNNMIGAKAVKISSNEPAAIDTEVPGTPDSLNIIIVDSFTSLATKLSNIHYELNK